MRGGTGLYQCWMGGGNVAKIGKWAIRELNGISMSIIAHDTLPILDPEHAPFDPTSLVDPALQPVRHLIALAHPVPIVSHHTLDLFQNQPARRTSSRGAVRTGARSCIITPNIKYESIDVTVLARQPKRTRSAETNCGWAPIMLRPATRLQECMIIMETPHGV